LVTFISLSSTSAKMSVSSVEEVKNVVSAIAAKKEEWHILSVKEKLSILKEMREIVDASGFIQRWLEAKYEGRGIDVKNKDHLATAVCA
jgi:hypothetical protein